MFFLIKFISQPTNIWKDDVEKRRLPSQADGFYLASAAFCFVTLEQLLLSSLNTKFLFIKGDK